MYLKLVVREWKARKERERRKREREGRKDRKSQIRPMWLGHSEQEDEFYQGI